MHNVIKIKKICLLVNRKISVPTLDINFSYDCFKLNAATVEAQRLNHTVKCVHNNIGIKNVITY